MGYKLTTINKLSAANITDSLAAAITKDELKYIASEIANDASLWRGKSLAGMDEISARQIEIALDTAEAIKLLHKSGNDAARFAYPRTLALIFEKPSLRTRTSFEAGMAQMHGASVYLAPADVGLGTRESVEDVAGALSGWVDVIAARVFSHETVTRLRDGASIPIINALSDREHPLQMFADMLTLREQFGTLNGLKLAYIGDGNNVLNSLLLTGARLGVSISAACPAGYEPERSFVDEARQIASSEGTGAVIEITADPYVAVSDAHAVYTDVWASMGQEDEAAHRKQVFASYCIDEALMSAAREDAIALHCLPAHRGEEISAGVMDKFRHVIMSQAENRMHTQKALLLLILGPA